jgi:hypothetical protein
MRLGGFKPSEVLAPLAAAAVACLTLAGCAESERVLGPNWAGPPETPHGQELTPESANRHGIAGWVLLRCAIGDNQTSNNCFVLVETPPGWGFGTAALRSSQATQIRDAGNYFGHVPVVGETFNLPIFFCPPEKMPDCQIRMRADVTAFLPKLAAVTRMLRAKDCDGAMGLATETGYASFIALTKAECERSRRGG